MSKEKLDLLQGTLDLMVLRTLAAMGPQHGYGLARRIEQTSGDLLAVNYGTLYPARAKLEQAAVEVGYTRIVAPVDGIVSVWAARQEAGGGVAAAGEEQERGDE